MTDWSAQGYVEVSFDGGKTYHHKKDGTVEELVREVKNAPSPMRRRYRITVGQRVYMPAEIGKLIETLP